MPIIVHRTVIPAGQYVGLPRKIGNANTNRRTSRKAGFFAHIRFSEIFPLDFLIAFY